MLDVSHLIVSVSTVIGMYVVKIIKDKFFPEKPLPPVIVNVNVTASEPSAVKVSTDTPQLLKG